MTAPKSPRRAFLTGLGATVATVGAASAGVAAQAPAGRYQAARHTQDNWMDTLPGQHRMIIDGVTANGGGEALLFANNLFEANKSGYSIAERDVAIIVCMRHFATPFAFNDAIWAKYGAAMSGPIQFTDPKTKQPPSANLYNVASYGMTLPNLGNTIDSLVKRGAHFAVCDMATHFFATALAGANGNADAIYKELTANTVPNSHFVAAGVVAVNRAQERGYTLIYAG
ncbi:MAG TPA: hypothetical protein VH417_13865 [Vicinamibacterales bacterium]|jgi:hypothetical protein